MKLSIAMPMFKMLIKCKISLSLEIAKSTGKPHYVCIMIVFLFECALISMFTKAIVMHHVHFVDFSGVCFTKSRVFKVPRHSLSFHVCRAYKMYLWEKKRSAYD